MPKISFAGFHVVPDRNAPKSYFVKNGSPFRNRKTQISATAAMENAAVALICVCQFMNEIGRAWWRERVCVDV